MSEAASTDAYTGQCACGAVGYEVVGMPVVENHCQCRQCQRQTGGGRGSYLTFSGAAVAVTGEPRHWEAVGEGGTIKHSAFCGACGSPLFLTFPQMPDIFVVRAGSLDAPERFRPQLAMWASAGQAWDSLDPALAKFAKMPPS